MAAVLSGLSSRIAQAWQQGAGQFQGLDRRDPASWPCLPRLLLLSGLATAIAVALWMAVLSDLVAQLQDEQAQEARLKSEFSRKLPQALNLVALRRQKEQVQQQVTRLEQQLPGRSEIDGLLFDINQAGLGRNLHFDLFRPGQVAVKAYYAELPIALKVTGRYHDIGAFAADISQLSRIVTLNNLSVAPARDGLLVLEATAKTFRYLDPAEVEAQRKAAAPAATGAVAPPAAGGAAR